jgi:hypothetical protein
MSAIENAFEDATGNLKPKRSSLAGATNKRDSGPGTRKHEKRNSA